MPDKRSEGRSKRKKKGLAFAAVLAVLAFIMLILLFAPFLNIHSIEVYGENHYNEDEIRNLSGILPGENGFRQIPLSPEAILSLRLTEAEQKLKALPYVKSAVVRLVFPDTVAVTITERTPAAYIVYLGSYLTVDEEGYVLEVTATAPSEELKELRGIHFTKYAVGGRLEADNISLVRLGVDVLNAVKNSDSSSKFVMWDVLDWVDMVGSESAMLSLDRRVVVRFDPADKLQYTIDFTKQIFFTKLSSHEAGRLEFLNNEDPSFIPE